MRKIDVLFNTYAESHQNPTNKFIHWICIPLIMFSAIGFLSLIPELSDINWAVIVLAYLVIHVMSMSFPLGIGFGLIGFLMIYLSMHFQDYCVMYSIEPWKAILFIFIAAWIGQFIGHKIEGKKPSFFQDLHFLLIGPLWLLHFIYRKIGIKY